MMIFNEALQAAALSDKDQVLAGLARALSDDETPLDPAVHDIVDTLTDVRTGVRDRGDVDVAQMRADAAQALRQFLIERSSPEEPLFRGVCGVAKKLAGETPLEEAHKALTFMATWHRPPQRDAHAMRKLAAALQALDRAGLE